MHIGKMSSQRHNLMPTYLTRLPVENNYHLNKIYHELVKMVTLVIKAEGAFPSKTVQDKD
jgi:hypothetical protein